MDQTQTVGYELSLLGGFQLVAGQRSIDVPVSSQRLLAFLALHRRPVHRAHVAGALWPETYESRAAANLRTALWRLRGPSPDVVTIGSMYLGLGAGVLVDLRALELLAHALLYEAEPIDLAGIDPNALAGELLPDLWDAWLVIERERIRQVSLHALEALGVRCLGAGLLAQAVLAAAAAVEADPLRESANRLLVEAHMAEGNTSEAIKQFDRYRRVLDGELGLAPGAAFCDLVHERTRALTPS